MASLKRCPDTNPVCKSGLFGKRGVAGLGLCDIGRGRDVAALRFYDIVRSSR